MLRRIEAGCPATGAEYRGEASRGTRRLLGEVLDDNAPMLRLARACGCRGEATEEPDVVRVVLALAPEP